jgi:hypothetical protein
MPYKFLARVPYNETSGPWSKYPDLANILHDEPCTPKYNVIANNILCGGLTALGGMGEWVSEVPSEQLDPHNY